MTDRDRETEEKSEGFRVKDRRRFDSSGNERGDAPPPGQAAPAAERVASRPGAGPAPEAHTDIRANGHEAHAPSEHPEMETEGLDFSSFIMSLASQALWQLGLMQPPPGVRVEVDKEAAKQTIDIISLLEQKTKGNLDPVEERLLSEILHELRMNFVRVK